LPDKKPVSPSSEQPRNRPASFLQQLAFALELPFFPVVGVLLGGILGYWLDGKVGMRPLFALLFGAGGFAAGIAALIRRASSENKS
jgi:F0F1-type ATP synthase assembly protein I